MINLGLYQMTKNKKWGCFRVYGIGNLHDRYCVALPVMTTFKENVVYEVEMIGGGLLVIRVWVAGSWKRSGSEK